MKQLAFIGTGNMGGALARAAAAGGHAGECIFANRTRSKAQELADELGVTDVADSNADAARRAKFILLGVKPQMMAGVLAELAPVLKERKEGFVLVSMAAGLSIAALRQMAGGEYPVIRIMPNTPCSIGKGMTLVTRSENTAETDTDELCMLLQKAGRFDFVDENLFDAGSAAAGCSPAWAYMFIEALADGAVEAGLPRAKAMEYAAQAVYGAAAMVLETGLHPGALKDAVTSPAGSTIAGVRALEERGFRGAAMSAVRAAVERTKEMGKAK